MKNQIIKIMPDYQCFPLWRIGKGTVENVSPNEFPITETLKRLIINWQKKYDETLNQDNPSESGFRSIFEEQIFDNEGLVIWKEMIRELKDSYEVKYFSVKDGILYDKL